MSADATFGVVLADPTWTPGRGLLRAIRGGSPELVAFARRIAPVLDGRGLAWSTVAAAHGFTHTRFVTAPAHLAAALRAIVRALPHVHADPVYPVAAGRSSATATCPTPHDTRHLGPMGLDLGPALRATRGRGVGVAILEQTVPWNADTRPTWLTGGSVLPGDGANLYDHAAMSASVLFENTGLLPDLVPEATRREVWGLEADSGAALGSAEMVGHLVERLLGLTSLGPGGVVAIPLQVVSRTGEPRSPVDGTILGAAVAILAAAGVTTVVAAGNHGTALEPPLPRDSPVPAVAVHVGAALPSRDGYVPNPSSNFGAAVDAAAPGWSIPALDQHGDPVFFGDTSAACCLLAGALAQVQALGRTQSTPEVVAPPAMRRVLAAVATAPKVPKFQDLPQTDEWTSSTADRWRLDPTEGTLWRVIDGAKRRVPDPTRLVRALRDARRIDASGPRRPAHP